jgi:hypothetical protein
MARQLQSEPFGRIRLREDQAQLLLEVLSERRHRTIVRRADAKERGEDTHPYNRIVLRIDNILSELRRTMQEMGWDDGSA